MSEAYYSRRTESEEAMEYFNPQDNEQETSLHNQSHPSPTLSINSTGLSASSFSPTGFSPSTFSPTAKKSRQVRTHMGLKPTFHTTKQLANLYSIDRTCSYSIHLDPQVERGFFQAGGIELFFFQLFLPIYRRLDLLQEKLLFRLCFVFPRRSSHWFDNHSHASLLCRSSRPGSCPSL
jgi:hypothetical protein